MAYLSKPEKPLKILTIDGGGLQGISSLLILDRLLTAIARNNGINDSKPRPCDVFDVISGIGPGGWLALLLGRFQMDVASAYAEWYNLIDCITPNSKAEEMYMRLKQHCTYDRKRLIEQTEQLTEFYETNEYMFFEPPKGTRCKHVFVSALKTDSKDRHLGYNLFRTYDHPNKGARVLEGPNPRTYRISHAFGVTGAAKYFTTPWKEPSTNKKRLRFQDTKFPCPHNITELALDEMWGLYGEDVEISVLVNIGPGIPNKLDCKTIARRFSWGLTPTTTANRKQNHMSGASIANNDLQGGLGHDNPTIRAQESHSHDAATPQIKFDANLPTKAGDVHQRGHLLPRPTFGSDHHVPIEEKLKRSEDDIEDHIREKLRIVYPQNTPPYYRLAPEQSAPGTTQNDTVSPRTSFDATQRYLSEPKVKATIRELGRTTPFEVAVNS